MKYHAFGKTGLRVSAIGVGAQSLGGGLYFRDDAEAIRTLNAAFDAGINFYDTADHYNHGVSEELIGKIFQGRRDKVIIATKVGTRYSPLSRLAQELRPVLRPVSKWLRPSKIHIHRLRAAQKHGDFSASYLRSALEASLKRLKTDYIDLLQLHKPPTSVIEEGEFCKTLEQLKTEGKLRFYGVACDHGPTMIDDALLCLKYPGVSSVQVALNLVQRQAIADLLPRAQAHGVAVLARNPRDQGYLTTTGSDIMAETYEKTSQEVQTRMEQAKRFHFLVRSDRTLAQAALGFLLQVPGVAVVLPRLYRRPDLAETLGTLQAPSLTLQELEKIAATNV